MRNRDIELGDIFVDLDGGVFHYMKINAEGTESQHTEYCYRLERLGGIGFWDAWKTDKAADEDIGKLVEDGFFEHYTDWSIILRDGVDEIIEVEIDRVDF